MKNLFNLKSMMVALSLAACTMIAVSCDDDDDEIGKGVPSPDYVPYSGKCVVTSSMQGREVLRDTIDTQVSVVYLQNKIIAFQTASIDSLYVPMTKMSIKMPYFFIDSLTVDGNHFYKEPYMESNVSCNLNGQDGIYDCTGKLDGTVNEDGTLDVVYDFKLGKMPLSIQMDFTGKKEQ